MGNLDMSLMQAMHNALRRELDHLARATARTDTDPRRILANAAGWVMFKKALLIHHGAEDEALWPVMRQTLADRPDELSLLDAMEAEHAAIDPLLEEIDAALVDWHNGPERVALAADALHSALTGHLKHEEDQTLPLIDAVVTAEQWGHFGQVHGARTGPDSAILIPWLLDGAAAETIATMLALLPEPVRAAYRERWHPAYAALDRWNTSA